MPKPRFPSGIVDQRAEYGFLACCMCPCRRDPAPSPHQCKRSKSASRLQQSNGATSAPAAHADSIAASICNSNPPNAKQCGCAGITRTTGRDATIVTQSPCPEFYRSLQPLKEAKTRPDARLIPRIRLQMNNGPFHLCQGVITGDSIPLFNPKTIAFAIPSSAYASVSG